MVLLIDSKGANDSTQTNHVVQVSLHGSQEEIIALLVNDGSRVLYLLGSKSMAVTKNLNLLNKSEF